MNDVPAHAPHLKTAAQVASQREMDREDKRANREARGGNIYANLPQIVEILGIDDAGEFGDAECPHCLAKGRYIIHFRCDDGTTRGAMRGCIQKFKMHRYAKRVMAIKDKEQDNKKTGRALASWDVDVLNAIDAWLNSEISEADCDRAIFHADQRKGAWMKRRGFRR